MQNLSSVKQANECESGVEEAAPVQLTYEERQLAVCLLQRTSIA